MTSTLTLPPADIHTATPLLRQRLVETAADVLALTDERPVITFDAADALNELLENTLAPSAIRVLTALRVVAEAHADSLLDALDRVRAAERLAAGYDHDAGCLETCQWFQLQGHGGCAHCPACEQQVVEAVEERVSDLLTLMESVAPRATRELVRWDQTS